MRFKGLALLGLILSLLILYLLLFEIPSGKRKDEEEIRSKKVILFKEEEVKGYEIRSDQYDISVERADNGPWKITRPIRTDPDPGRINRFIALLENIEVKRVVEERPPDLKIFGLDKPDMDILLRLKDKEEWIMLGVRGPIKNTLYIKRGGDGKILLVDDRLIEDIPDKFSTWRRAKVLPFDTSGVDEIRLESRERSFLINKENDKWTLKKPIDTAADTEEVNDILSSLSRLSAREFIDEGKEEFLKKISPPILKAGLKIKEEEKVVSFYRPRGKEKGIIYASTVNEDPIYVIDELLLKGFDKDLFRLREKQALDLNEKSVAGIEIKKENESIKLAKKKDDWIIESMPDQKIDKSKITDLFDALKKIRAEKFVDEAPADLSRYGLNPPRSAINIFNNENKPVGALLFGREKGDMSYAKNDRSGSIFLVKKESLGSIPARRDLIGK